MGAAHCVSRGSPGHDGWGVGKPITIIIIIVNDIEMMMMIIITVMMTIVIIKPNHYGW